MYQLVNCSVESLISTEASIYDLLHAQESRNAGLFAGLKAVIQRLPDSLGPFAAEIKLYGMGFG